MYKLSAAKIILPVINATKLKKKPERSLHNYSIDVYRAFTYSTAALTHSQPQHTNITHLQSCDSML